MPAWEPCRERCEEYWCNLHAMHVCDCPCPEIDDLSFDPYSEDGPARTMVVAPRVERAQLARMGEYIIPGRRRTGIVIHDPNLAKAFRPLDAMEGVPRNIAQGAALELASRFTRRSVLAKAGGMHPCTLVVNFPPRKEFAARSWHAALEKLNTFLKMCARWDPKTIDI